MKRIVMAASLLLGCFLYPINALSDTICYTGKSCYYNGNLKCSGSDMEKANDHRVTEPFLNPVTGDSYVDYYWPVYSKDIKKMDVLIHQKGEPIITYYDNGKPRLCDNNDVCKYSDMPPECKCDNEIGIWESEGLSLKAVQEDCRFGSKCVMVPPDYIGTIPLYHTGQDYVFEYRYGDQKNIVRQSGGRPVYAVNNGLVIASGEMRGINKKGEETKSGYYVIIEHYADYPKQFHFTRPFKELYRDYEWFFPDSRTTAQPVNVEKIYSYYLHLEGDDSLVQKCKFVEKGKIIGRTYTFDQTKKGNKAGGYESDPHLHFEIWTRLIKGGEGYLNWKGYDRDDKIDDDKIDDEIVDRFLTVYADPQFFFDQDHQQTFGDISGSAFEKAILALAKMGIVETYRDGLFHPDLALKRARLTEWSLLTAKKAINEPELPKVRTWQDQFSDIDKNDKNSWYKKPVIEAYEAGIIDGYPDGEFKPEKLVNRVEMIKIVLGSVCNISIKENSGMFSSWYTPYLEKAKELNIAPVYDKEREDFLFINDSSADEEATREEAAKALYDAYCACSGNC